MSLSTVTLSSGHKVPALAYGLGTHWFKTTSGQLDQKTMDGVKLALKLGYRHLDGAQIYNNEAEIGCAVAESGVPRSELFITTKAKEYGNIENSLEQSLKLLKTDYVDLYLVHNPFGATIEQLRDAWKGMESVARRGLAKSIGVSNFGILQLQAVLDVATIIPSINQIELHPYLPQDELRAFMKQKGVGLEAYGPVTPLSRAAPGPVDPVVQRLARKYAVSDTSVLLRWVIDQGYLAVSTSGSEERLKAMITEVPSFKLTDDEVKELLQVGRGKTYRHFMASHFKAMGIEP